MKSSVILLFFSSALVAQSLDSLPVVLDVDSVTTVDSVYHDEITLDSIPIHTSDSSVVDSSTLPSEFRALDSTVLDTNATEQKIEYEIDSANISDETRDKFIKSYIEKYKTLGEHRTALEIVNIQLRAIDTTRVEKDSLLTPLLTNDNTLIKPSTLDSIQHAEYQKRLLQFSNLTQNSVTWMSKIEDLKKEMLNDSANLAVYQVSVARLRDDYFRQYGEKRLLNPRWFEEYKLYPLDKPQWFSEHSRLRINFRYSHSNPKTYTTKNTVVDDQKLRDAGYDSHATEFVEKDWYIQSAYLWQPWLATELQLRYQERSGFYRHYERANPDLSVEQLHVLTESWSDIFIKQHAILPMGYFGNIEGYVGLSLPFGNLEERGILYLSERVLPQYFMSGAGSLGTLLGVRYTYRITGYLMLQSSVDYSMYGQNDLGVTASSSMRFNQVLALTTTNWFGMYLGFDHRAISAIQGRHKSTALTNFLVAPLYNNAFYEQTIQELFWGTNIRVPFGILEGAMVGLMVNFPFEQQVVQGYQPTTTFRWNLGIYLPL